MVILLIDNYDSFTYNLVQMLREAGAEVDVIRNDAEDVDTVLNRGAKGIVLSPGPGRPEGAGICIELLRRRADVPILGVCLGHQALGAAYGARVERAPVLMHGKTSKVAYRPDDIFDSLPNPFDATRYHSLAVPEESLPRELRAIAWTDDGIVMAMRHQELPYWGVQFHPESVLTPVGPTLLTNFLNLCGLADELVPVNAEPQRLFDQRSGVGDRRSGMADRRMEYYLAAAQTV